MIFAIGKIEDAINVALPVTKNALSSHGTATAREIGIQIPAPKPASTDLYAIAKSQVLKTRTPFRTEAEMMSKLADVLSEMK